MSVEAAIYDILSKASAVTAICGKRIYPIALPQGKSVPAVLFQQISSQDVVSTSGHDGLRTDRVQVTCWDDDPDGARTLAEAVRTALLAATGSHGGSTIRYCSIEDEGDAFDLSKDNEQLDRYGKRQDWQVCYS